MFVIFFLFYWAVWQKNCISCKMLKDLDWLHLTVGFVYEVSKPWPSVLKSNRFLILSIRAIWCFSWIRTVLCALNLSQHMLCRGVKNLFPPLDWYLVFRTLHRTTHRRLQNFSPPIPEFRRLTMLDFLIILGDHCIILRCSFCICEIRCSSMQ